MNTQQKIIMISIIAMMILPTITTTSATNPETYHSQTKITARYILDGQLGEWAWGKSNLILIPEKNIASLNGVLKTIDGMHINYRLKDLLGLRYVSHSESWHILGVYEVKYGEQVILVEAELVYSARWNIFGSVWVPGLGDGGQGSHIGPTYYPASIIT